MGQDEDLNNNWGNTTESTGRDKWRMGSRNRREGHSNNTRSQTTSTNHPTAKDSVDTMGMGRSPTGGRTPIDRMARFGYAVHSELW